MLLQLLFRIGKFIQQSVFLVLEQIDGPFLLGGQALIDIGLICQSLLLSFGSEVFLIRLGFFGCHALESDIVLSKLEYLTLILLVKLFPCLTQLGNLSNEHIGRLCEETFQLVGAYSLRLCQVDLQDRELLLSLPRW